MRPPRRPACAHPAGRRAARPGPPTWSPALVTQDNDDDEREHYYAGGQGQNGGGSGQEILDPTKPQDFMKRAREEMGGETIDQYRANNPQGSSAFQGVGHSLASGSAVGEAMKPPPAETMITFWKNGFSVNIGGEEGPLRNPQDPENAAFLAAINRGQMPAELMGPDGEPDGDVHILDKSGQNYVPPKPKPFAGEGRTMRDESAASATPAAAVEGAAELVVDADAPTTTLQIRLADGSRKVVKANHTHTVLQLTQHVATLSPPGSAFVLKAGFPPKALADMSATLKDAGVLGDSITQSMQ